MIYWDPDPDLFIIPVLNWPIKWYGLLFALGFAIGFPLFKDLLLRFFLQDPKFTKEEMAGGLNVKVLRLESKLACKDLSSKKIEAFKKLVIRAGGADSALARLCWDEKLGEKVYSLKEKALQITDKLTIYMVLATIIGARLGHFLFYEKPSSYLRDPMELLRFREGGLASHGAAIAILVALWIFSCGARKVNKGLTWFRLLDFICIPTALGACFIRLGNFANQEILGTWTTLPWGVVFGHPADGSYPAPRHPVQLYEAFAYFVVFIFLWRLSFRPRILLSEGKLIGLFLIFVFAFRFFIEFFKEEQSHLLNRFFDLTMGQWLSIPFVLLGLFLIFYDRCKSMTISRFDSFS